MELMPKPDSCAGCPYYDNWQKDGYIPGSGPTAIGTPMIVGEGGGEQEEIQAKGFVGGSGRVLRKWLHEANLNPNDFRYNNVVSCRPPGNEDPAPSAVEHCRANLERELSMVRPNLVITVGDFALNWFTGRKKITMVMGYVFPFRDTKVLALAHPAMVMYLKNSPRGKNIWAMQVAYLRKVPQLLSIRGWTPPPEPFIEEPTLADVRMLGDMLNQMEEPEVIFDVENPPDVRRRQAKLLIVGLGIPGKLYISINMNPRSWVDWEYEEMVSIVGGILASPKVLKTGHNLPHDVEVSIYNGFEVNGPFFDTILAHHVTYGEMRHALGIIAPLYTLREYWKDQGHSAHEEK